MLRNNMLPKNFSPKKGKGVSMLRKKHGKNHQKRGSTPAGMTDGQISKTDLSRFKMGGQLSPEYLFYKIVSQTSLNNHSFTMFN